MYHILNHLDNSIFTIFMINYYIKSIMFHVIINILNFNEKNITIDNYTLFSSPNNRNNHKNL